MNAGKRASIWALWLILAGGGLGGAFGQDFEISPDIQVRRADNRLLANPWTGGMETPVYSSLDLDKDGKQDLVIFDSSDRTFQAYLNEGTPGEVAYRWAPQYLSAFDSCDCTGWALFRDTNCDGLNDLLCGNTRSDVQVYEQRYGGEQGIVFELRYDRLRSKIFNPLPLNVNKIDVPAILDVDYDGDLDILTFGLASNFIEFHRNFAIERLARCDTFVLEAETICWGHFYESDSDNTATINDTVDCPLGDFVPRGAAPRHTGSTTLMLDLNADSTYDALIGDISFDEVYALYNGGTPQYAYIDSVERFFPQSSEAPIQVTTFPACFYVDVDNDQVRDLLVAPHAASSYENRAGTLWYRNAGADNAPKFKYQGFGFLQEDELDMGAYAFPAFADLQGKGPFDLIVGNRGTFEPGAVNLRSALSLLIMSGTPDAPAYRWVSEDFLGLSKDNRFQNTSDLHPALGDLNGDGHADLLLGHTFGTLFFFAGTGEPWTGTPFLAPEENFADIDAGWYSAPYLYDLDADNDLDLIVGNRQGYLQLYENKGDKNTPVFERITEQWGQLWLTEEPDNPFAFGFARPVIADADRNGTPDLVVGDISGKIQVFTGLSMEAEARFTPLPMLDKVDFGRYSAPAMGAFSDSTQWLVAGNLRGGLTALKQEKIATSTLGWLPAPTIRIYPNPTREILTLEGAVEEPLILKWIDMLGRVIRENTLESLPATLDIGTFPRGNYLLKIQSRKGLWVGRINKG